MKGLEPPRLAAPDPKSGASTNFATSALRCYQLFLVEIRKRTNHYYPFVFTFLQIIFPYGKYTP